MSSLEKNIIIVSVMVSFAWIFIGLNLSYVVLANSDDGTNISYAPNAYWAWNDVIGWINFHDTHTVTLAPTKLKGYASSTPGDVSFDCSTARTGPTVCDSSNYKVLHDENGNLSGWAWNNAIGWISFCGGQATSDCPGNISYQVEVDLGTGRFKRESSLSYAWNDAVGWISFDCLNHDFPSCDYEYYVSIGANPPAVGILESTPYDTGATGGAKINSVSWRGALETNTAVYFQLAGSNSSTGPWNFVGPDGTANTYYGPVLPDGTSGSGKVLEYTLHNNERYFKYKVFMYSDTMHLKTPRIDDIMINWSP